MAQNNRRGAFKVSPTAKEKTPPDINRMQRRLEYLKRTRPQDKEIKVLERRIGKTRPGTTAPELTPYGDLPREQQVERAMEAGGQAYENLVNRYMTSDPYQMQQRYETAFAQEMERARQNVLSQFERRNQEEFARQNLATQQSIVERGLDPNSEAAQALMRANTQRQDLARQEAQSAAEQAAYSAQQQGFSQAYQTGMMPYEQFQAINAPFMAGVGAQYTQEQAQQQRTFEAQQAELTRQAQLQAARIGRGGGGGAAPDPYAAFNQYVAAQTMQNYQPSTPKPNLGASAVQGFTAGATAGITQNLRR